MAAGAALTLAFFAVEYEPVSSTDKKEEGEDKPPGSSVEENTEGGVRRRLGFRRRWSAGRLEVC